MLSCSNLTQKTERDDEDDTNTSAHAEHSRNAERAFVSDVVHSTRYRMVFPVCYFFFHWHRLSTHYRRDRDDDQCEEERLKERQNIDIWLSNFYAENALVPASGLAPSFLARADDHEHRDSARMTCRVENIAQAASKFIGHMRRDASVRAAISEKPPEAIQKCP